jgi:hypothetical protein
MLGIKAGTGRQEMIADSQGAHTTIVVWASCRNDLYLLHVAEFKHGQPKPDEQHREHECT